LSEVLVRILSALLKIKEKVAIIDIEQWTELYEDFTSKKKKDQFVNDIRDTFGMSMPEDRLIWLNPRLCKREYNVLITTIIHELLHVKYPTMKEERIQEMERNLTGRYDYKRLEKKMEGLKKCQKALRQ
jgi:predicted metal-dependent hydrolase